jgi:hypothetical protein
MLTFAYAGVRFVNARKRVSKPARDDVSCDNSRAERVVRILAALFTAVNIVYERKQHIRPGGGDVSEAASRAERAIGLPASEWSGICLLACAP